ncbi:alpha/beta fold hydrolase [Raoultella terrigena]|uniref:alpha/beta fold hydrolase n=1 Tax=Raoultella terrigena TaxID=577 RepID=UPI001F5239C5|nr:alpha/beta hydrolase [Raoultella terrigena]MCI1034829.1 alpha/beta hydrolase [Raoultella terrigena]
MNTKFKSQTYNLTINNVDLNVAAIHRSGQGEPILFLHGFGSTKEDYADIVRYVEFNGQPFLAYDAPGCGETQCSDLGAICIPFLVEVAMNMVDELGFERFHLVGHSMGGLTALVLAHAYPERIMSFVDIEGNIAPEDCFLSRQVIHYPDGTNEQFFDDFIARTRHAPAWASALYSSSLRYKVRAGAVRHIFKSMVDYSDHGELMDKFLNLPCPKMFMYGEQNSTLSYLESIKLHGVKLAEVPECGHFPMYSNPVIMWRKISEFQKLALQH